MAMCLVLTIEVYAQLKEVIKLKKNFFYRWGVGTAKTHGGFWSGPDRWSPGNIFKFVDSVCEIFLQINKNLKFLPKLQSWQMIIRWGRPCSYRQGSNIFK